MKFILEAIRKEILEKEPEIRKGCQFRNSAALA
jgi:hypothetical protein